MPAGSYWTATRAPRYALIFVFPLLVAYEGLAAFVSGEEGVRNGADVLLKSLFVLLGGRHGLTLFAVALGGTGAALVIRDLKRQGPPVGRYFALMAVESIVYAALLGGVTSLLTALLLEGPSLLAAVPAGRLDLATAITVSLGAGLYEELLFRVLLVSLLARGAEALLGWRPAPAGAGAAVVGALIFSAFHYLGPLGDAFAVRSFVFRTVAGLLLSALYLLRGFGIAAWTHALYDVLLALGTAA